MWRKILTERTSNVTDRTSAMRFLNESVAHEFFVPDYFESKYFSAAGTSGSPFGSALLGTGKVRQLRVRPADCHSLHQKLTDQGIIKSTECYPSWVEGAEEKTFKTFSQAPPSKVLGDYDFLEYSSAEVTQESEYQGSFGVYHGGGFVGALSSRNALDMVAAMEQVKWLDPKTRAVFFEFVAYSPNDDIFASCRVCMEFIPGGIVKPTITVYGFLLDRYPSEGSSSKIGLEVLVYTTLVLYLINEYRHFQHERWKRYMRIDWVLLDVLNYALFLAGAYYKAVYLRSFYAELEADTGRSSLPRSSLQVTASIKQIALSLEFQDKLAGANGFLLWIKLFKYALITRRLLRLGHTIAASFLNLITFGFLFFIVAYAFAIGGHLLFSQELDEFMTINASARTMLRAVFGEALFERLVAAAGLSGYFYLLTWLMVSQTILLNVVISILHDAYQSVLAHEIEHPSLTVYMKIMNEWERRKEEREKLALLIQEESPGKKARRKSGLSLNEDTQHDSAKRRLGWVPTEERDWAPFGKDGASPPNKKPSTKSFV